jgi:hypothetical protein
LEWLNGTLADRCLTKVRSMVIGITGRKAI